MGANIPLPGFCCSCIDTAAVCLHHTCLVLARWYMLFSCLLLTLSTLIPILPCDAVCVLCSSGTRRPLGVDFRGQQYWVLGGAAGAWRVFVEQQEGILWVSSPITCQDTLIADQYNSRQGCSALVFCRILVGLWCSVTLSAVTAYSPRRIASLALIHMNCPYIGHFLLRFETTLLPCFCRASMRVSSCYD